MTDIIWTLTPEDIEWEMDNTSIKEVMKDKPEHHIHARKDKEMEFEQTAALAHLLMNEVIFLNNHWWQEDWPKEAREMTSLNVNCNDVFAWGCADAEELPYREIENLYRMWQKEPHWGPAMWCIIKRRELPQKPVHDRMVKAGWDLDALAKEHNLRPNIYSGLSGLFARRKYDLYCAWEKARGNVALVFDGGWWNGWKEYKEAHPDFKEYGDDSEWHKEDMRLRAEWLEQNGFKEGEEND